MPNNENCILLGLITGMLSACMQATLAVALAQDIMNECYHEDDQLFRIALMQAGMSPKSARNFINQYHACIDVIPFIGTIDSFDNLQYWLEPSLN